MRFCRAEPTSGGPDDTCNAKALPRAVSGSCSAPRCHRVSSSRPNHRRENPCAGCHTIGVREDKMGSLANTVASAAISAAGITVRDNSGTKSKLAAIATTPAGGYHRVTSGISPNTSMLCPSTALMNHPSNTEKVTPRENRVNNKQQSRRRYR